VVGKSHVGVEGGREVHDSSWRVAHPTLELREPGLLTLSTWRFACPTLEVRELEESVWVFWRCVDPKSGLGDAGRIHAKPLLLLKWSLGSTHFFLTMNLLRFLQVLSDGLPWLDTHNYNKLKNLQLCSKALMLHQFSILRENHEVTCSIQPSMLEGKQFEEGSFVTPHF